MINESEFTDEYVLKLQEEINKLTAESTEWEERTYCWQDRAENLQIVLDKIKEYVENLLKEEFEITDPDNINYGEKCQRAYFSDSELGRILELLEEIE